MEAKGVVRTLGMVALFSACAAAEGGARTQRSSWGVEVDIPEGFAPTAESSLRLPDIVGRGVEVEGIFERPPSAGAQVPSTFAFAFAPRSTADGGEHLRDLSERLQALGEGTVEHVAEGRSRIRVVGAQGPVRMEHRIELLSTADGVALAMFLLPAADAPSLEPTMTATLRSLRPSAPSKLRPEEHPTAGPPGSSPSGGGPGLLVWVGAFLMLAAVVGARIWFGSLIRQEREWTPARRKSSLPPLPQAPAMTSAPVQARRVVGPPATSPAPARTPVKSPSRWAFDRLRQRRAPDDIVSELVTSGLSPVEARDAVDEGAWRLYERDRRTAMGNAVAGGIAFVVGTGLSAWSLLASQGGGLVVLFYGAIIYGLAEIVRALRRWPRRPDLQQRG